MRAYCMSFIEEDRMSSEGRVGWWYCYPMTANKMTIIKKWKWYYI